MKNKIILTGVFLLFSFFASAQIDYDVPINQFYTIAGYSLVA